MATKYINALTMEEPAGTFQLKVRNLDYSNTRHWVLNKATRNPNQRVLIEYEEKGTPCSRWYAGYVMYNPKTGELKTWGRLPFFCPHRSYHRSKSTCPVCGAKG